LSDEWDFYFARIDDAVSSVFVDLGIKADAPAEKRPWLLWVWIVMQAPKPDGLSSSEEAPKLHAIGEALDSTISATCGAQLVGRVTGNGRREFYFYAAEPGELTTAVSAAMANFPGYRHECGSTFQPDWDQYFTLYPSESNLERMQNRRLLEALAADGDVHELPRKVEHWFAFADEDTRAACRETLTAIEFTLEDESQSEDEGDILPFALVVSRADSVDSHTINGITIELARLAREHRGRYDGWQCTVTREGP
jgi:regulator of RNase E activity RraB